MSPKTLPDIKQAVILAGGLSRRFGSDKAQALLDGQSLLEHVLERLTLCGFTVALSVASPEQYPAWSGVQIVDETVGQGPLAAIEGSFRQLSQARILFLACDMPLLKSEVIEQLWCCDPAADLVTLQGQGKKKMLPGVYLRRAAALAGTLLAGGRRDLKSLCETSLITRELSEGEWRPFDPQGLSLTNINDRKELERIQSVLIARSA